MSDESANTNQDAEDGAASASDANTDQGKGELTFDSWFASLDEPVKNLLDEHTKGLKSALDAERETRKTFEKQIKDLAAKAEKGSEAEARLNELSAQLELSERRASFAELASREGVTNPKALFILAEAGQFFNKKGEADLAGLKETYPEFFKRSLPEGNAGEGASGQPAGLSMNDIIRSAANAKIR